MFHADKTVVVRRRVPIVAIFAGVWAIPALFAVIETYTFNRLG